MGRSQLFRCITIALLTAACVSATARDSDDIWNTKDGNRVWRGECGACHMAYPPGLLSAEDWLIIMVQLDRHFGVDASLEPAVSAEIAAYLKQKGASLDGFGNRGEEPPRITTSTRFQKKHRSAIRLWSRGQLKSLADCAACHREAGTPQ
jgi:mono/diheme cytochrome c family protein